jgi:O-glycosyl hydrolase
MKRFSRHFLSSLAALAWTAAGLLAHASTTAADDPPPLVVEVNPAQRFQQIRGFGASGAWWPNYVAEFPEKSRDRLLRLLFTDAGADMTIYRYNLPAGAGEDVTAPLRRTAAVETAPGVYDFEQDWKARRILREVRALGVEQFVLFAKSPPPRLLRNGMVSGGDHGLSNLRPDAREEFANYLLDLTEHYTKEFDLPRVVLSPINEPQWHWGRDRRHQEGCYYTPEETAAMLRTLIEANLKRGLDIEIEGPESGEWKNANYDLARTLFSDPVIRENLRTFAVHSYWSSPQDRRRFVAWFHQQYPDKALAMTEYCQMEHGHDLGIGGGLHMARVMHEDLVVANVETWQWWLCIFTGGYKDALIYAHPRTQRIEPTKRLWTMGNFSRFIRPGATRIAARSDGDLLVSAYLSKEEDQVAIVIINNGEVRNVQPSLPGGQLEQTQAWVTSAEHDLAKMETRLPVLTIPAESITTLVVPLGD